MGADENCQEMNDVSEFDRSLAHLELRLSNNDFTAVRELITFFSRNVKFIISHDRVDACQHAHDMAGHMMFGSLDALRILDNCSSGIAANKDEKIFPTYAEFFEPMRQIYDEESIILSKRIEERLHEMCTTDFET